MHFLFWVFPQAEPKTWASAVSLGARPRKRDEGSDREGGKRQRRCLLLRRRCGQREPHSARGLYGEYYKSFIKGYVNSLNKRRAVACKSWANSAWPRTRPGSDQETGSSAVIEAGRDGPRGPEVSTVFGKLSVQSSGSEPRRAWDAGGGLRRSRACLFLPDA